MHTPIPEFVARLNAYRPAVIVGYASVIRLLATEQEAGRLHISPVLVQPAGDAMTTRDLDRIAAAFGTTVRPIYSCTECIYLSNGCAQGWYHVQPFLRYDLGDSVRLRPDPCPCGNPLPAIRVRGRAGDTLSFPAGRGGAVSLAPLALSTLFDRTPGVELFQLEQTAPTTLRVRMLVTAGTEPGRVWQTVLTELEALLADNDLGTVTLERAEEPPRQEPGGGKYRTIIPLR